MAAKKKAERCETCKMACDDKLSSKGMLVCRRLPPVRIESDSLRSFYPRIEANDWCGEYKAK